MRKVAPVFALLIFALSLSAGVRTGQVQGRILDKDGKPLAGVRVTLMRPQAADQTLVTGPSGIFRFPDVRPGSDYSVKAEHPDHKTSVRTTVAVAMGGRVAFDIPLETGKPEETTSLKAPSRAIDPTRFTAGAEFDGMMLQALPTTRDPWAIIQLVPGVLVDRENVGGNESGEQARFVTRGDDANGLDTIWTVDDVDVTDPVDLGLSAIAYDFDAIEALSVRTGGAADVSQQTGGIAVNLLTRRGGNKLSGMAHFYLTDHAFQSGNLTSELKSQGVSDTNRIQQIRDFGASAGGPILKDHLGVWGSYGVQDLFTYTIYGTPDRTDLSHYSFKLNAEIFKGNRAEALFTTSSKERFGANADAARPEGDHQTGRFALGSPIYKVQDEQVFGSSFTLSAKATWTNTGTTLRPAIDEAMANPAVFDIAEGRYVAFSSTVGRSWDHSQDIRAKKNLQILATLFRDRLLGMSHEIQAGLERSDRKATSVSGFAQNYEIFRDFTDPLIDLGDGLVVPPAAWQYFRLSRENRRVGLLSQSSGFLQDTISKGRFTVRLGLRYDSQKPSTGGYNVTTALSGWSNVFANSARTAFFTYFPSVSVRAIDPRYSWSTWSPRLGIAWDLRGDGRTVLKLSLAQYGDALAAGANVPEPLGLDANLNFWWTDGDADSLVDVNEIYWKHAATFAAAPNRLYALFDEDGSLTDAAVAALTGGFEGDAYVAGNFSGFDWADRDTLNYDYLTTFYRSDIDANAKNVKTSPRTREISLGLEKELGADLVASATATYRRTDNMDWAKLFYPADIYPSTPDLVIDGATWYTQAGIVPQTITYLKDEKETTIDLGEAGGKPWYLPSAAFPGSTPYRMVDKSSSYRSYAGLELVLTKRLSNRWFLNAAVTIQDQRAYWGNSYIDPTNKWAFDGKAYANVSNGAGGKVAVNMFSPWLAKLSALYQLPGGFDVSATLHARQGWAIPHYITLAYANAESWPGLYRSNTVYLQPLAKDHLPGLTNLTFRVAKSFKLGAGRMSLMVDVFNVLNAAVVNRAYDAYLGTYYVDTDTFVSNPFNRRPNEILNPRVYRLGLRFEF